jgi:hypothetical protein
MDGKIPANANATTHSQREALGSGESPTASVPNLFTAL